MTIHNGTSATGRSQGYGYVTFESVEEATAAIFGMHDTELDGRRLKVDLSSFLYLVPQSKFCFGLVCYW